ncbi:leucine-rich repeat domain-containing protein, partial [Blautia massiliensis]|uniref:leucine-rich repeat domain-containing protein n=2 Tax=Blautia massiliensis (ex Durand et al. 2017) TaxID=1737424 RepID=UPI00157029B5
MKMNRVLALILSSVMICTAVPGEVMAAEIELESEEDFSDEVGEFTELESGKSGEVTDETVDEIELQNEELDEIQALEFEDNADEENLFADEKTEEKAVLAKGEVGTGEWILYDDGEFIINGTYVPGYSRESAPWYRYHNQIKKIVVEEGINRIERAAFYGCDNVQEVDIADTVTSIEYDAFRNCTKLQAIILPHNLTKMDDSAFRDCKSLEKVEIPESLTSIPPRTFMGCSSLEDITLPKNITAIGDSVFENCSNLRQIQLPEGISAIPVSAFYNCKKLYEVYIPQSVERIETNAFGDCESLVNVQIPKGVKYIDSVAFDGCKSLRIVEILGALNRIETNVFLSCEKLEIIRYGGSFEEWNKFKVSVNANVGIYCDYNIYHSHVYEPKIIIPATCMEAGVVKNICKLCGDNYTEEIKATGHKEVKDAAVAATCEKAGKTEGSHCSVCNKVIKAQKEVPALGHSWDAGKITKEATCTETGVKTYTCTRCQKTKTEEIKATGHKEVKDAAVAATCEKAGKTEGSHCSVCNKVIKAQKEVPALGHSWDAGKITKEATCTETGVK